MAIKIFDLHLVEYQQGQMELCFFPKLLPKGTLLLWLLLFEQAVCFLLTMKGRTWGLDPSAVIFWGCWSGLWRQIGIFSTAQTPLNISRALATNTAENKHLLLFLRLYVLRILVQTNERVFLPANITDIFFFFFFSPLFSLLLFTCCSLCSTNNVLLKPGQRTLSVFRA